MHIVSDCINEFLFILINILSVKFIILTKITDTDIKKQAAKLKFEVVEQKYTYQEDSKLRLK